MLLCILFHFNIDVQNYSKCLGSLKISKKKTKTLYEISKCAINMCVVVLPLGVKFLAVQVWFLVLCWVTSRAVSCRAASRHVARFMLLNIAMISFTLAEAAPVKHIK